VVGSWLCAASASAEESIVVDGSTTVGPIAKAFAEFYMQRHPDVNVTVSESGSGNGAKSLINGVCDVADMSRFMKETEFKAAVDNGIHPVAHVVAIDGIAIVVHPANPVKKITMGQIKSIYMGKITNWRELGGPNEKIVVVSRDTNSGTYETFEKFVMEKERVTSRAEKLGSNGAVRQRVQDTEAAIGYVGMGFLDRTVKALEVNGIYPERNTVLSGLYPIARPLFMFTDGYPEIGSHVQSFVTLHLTEEGQNIVEAKGFVPLTSYKSGMAKASTK
jgi:phosphate transport system substrate-binding protein